MKAIIVLDEMPADCYDCPMSRMFEGLDFDSFDLICNAEKMKNKFKTIVIDYERGGKPSWCPIKEMPRKMDEEEYRQKVNGNGDYYEQVIGWNACIEEIEK